MDGPHTVVLGNGSLCIEPSSVRDLYVEGPILGYMMACPVYRIVEFDVDDEEDFTRFFIKTQRTEDGQCVSTMLINGSKMTLTGLKLKSDFWSLVDTIRRTVRARLENVTTSLAVNTAFEAAFDDTDSE